MNYWVSETTVNNGVWIAIAFAFVIVMNMFPASVYGETEFIFCSIKVLTIMGLISTLHPLSTLADGKSVALQSTAAPAQTATTLAESTGGTPARSASTTWVSREPRASSLASGLF